MHGLQSVGVELAPRERKSLSRDLDEAIVVIATKS